MANQYAYYPPHGSSVVTIYANTGSFPATAPTGSLAVDASTGNLYEFNGTSWVLIAGPGAALSLGNLDSQSPTAKGAALTGGILSMQSASLTYPGLVNNTAQTWAGKKTFNDGFIVIDNTYTPGSIVYDTPNGKINDLVGGNSIFNNARQLWSGNTLILDWSGTNALFYGGGITIGDVNDVDNRVTLAVSAAATGSHQYTLTFPLTGPSANSYETFDGSGNITYSTTLLTSQMPALTGDITTPGGSLATTLATVNSNVGSFTNASITVNGKGLITAASSGTAPVTSVSVASANGFAGSSSGGSAPTLTLSTTVTGILYGNGTSVAAAVAGNFPTLNQNTTGTAANVTATSNATLTTLSALTTASSLATVGTIGTGTWQGTAVGVGYGGTGQTSVTTSPTATSWAGWDANKNFSANAFIPGYTTTATAAGTTTLTVASTETQVFTGSTTQTVKLPTTSVAQGAQYTIINNSSGVVTVQSSGANTIVALAANTSGYFTANVATPTTAANWSYALGVQTAGTVTSVGLTMPGGFAVSGSPVTGSGTLGVTINAAFVNTNQANQFGSAAGSSTSPSNTNTNILLYNNSSTNYAGIGSDSSGNMYFVTGNGSPATRMEIDVGGGVGIGTGSNTTYGGLTVTNTASNQALAVTTNSATSAGNAVINFLTQASRGLGTAIQGFSTNTGEFGIYTGAGSNLGFYQESTGRVRINTGTARATQFQVGYTSSNTYCIDCVDTAASNNSRIINFNSANNGDVGYIQYGPAAATVLFTSVSDARLKTDIKPMPGLETIMKLNPVNFAWTANGQREDGFLAQEVHKVAPQAVAQGDDETVDCTAPEYKRWGVDPSKLVPYLTKAIQELKAEIDQLKAQLRKK